MRPSRTRQMLIPGRVTLRSEGDTPKISPCCVPLAVKCSTTRSPSPTRMPVSLCQSGKAARNMAPASRIPSRSAVTPSGGSWFTKSSARYSATAPRSPLVNRASIKAVTVFLFCSMVFMTAVFRRAVGLSTPAIWGFSWSGASPARVAVPDPPVLTRGRCSWSGSPGAAADRIGGSLIGLGGRAGADPYQPGGDPGLAGEGAERPLGGHQAHVHAAVQRDDLCVPVELEAPGGDLAVRFLAIVAEHGEQLWRGLGDECRHLLVVFLLTEQRP